MEKSIFKAPCKFSINFGETYGDMSAFDTKWEPACKIYAFQKHRLGDADFIRKLEKESQGISKMDKNNENEGGKEKMDLFQRYFRKVCNGWTTDDPEILTLADDYGRTIAYFQVKYGWRTEDKTILKLADAWDWSVAHEQAAFGWRTEDKEILKLSNADHVYVAHVQAHCGWTTEDKDILKLQDDWGISVAHIQAEHGWITQDPEILSLTTINGLSVARYISRYYEKDYGPFLDR